MFRYCAPANNIAKHTAEMQTKKIKNVIPKNETHKSEYASAMVSQIQKCNFFLELADMPHSLLNVEKVQWVRFTSESE